MKTSRIKWSGLPPACRLPASKQVGLPALQYLAGGRAGRIKKNLILITYSLILSLFLCQTYSHAAMKKMRDPEKPLPVQTIFLKKYKGIPVEGHLIKNLPYYSQGKNRNYCGPVALAMVLNYWNTGKIFTKEEIASDIFDSEVEITNNSEMVFYPQNNNFLVYSFNGDIEQLKNFIKKDIPVIILQQVVDKIVRKGHYRVITGYDDLKKVVIINDPWLGEKLAISYNIFSKLWTFGEGINKKNWALTILPKDKMDVFNKLEKSAVTHHNIATALYNRDNVQEAIKEWEKAIEIFPDEVTFHYCISYAYIQAEDYAKAIHYGESAVELDSNNSFCYDTLGWAYYNKGMLQEALKELEKAMQLNPKVDFIKNHYNIVAEKINRSLD